MAGDDTGVMVGGGGVEGCVGSKEGEISVFSVAGVWLSRF